MEKQISKEEQNIKDIIEKKLKKFATHGVLTGDMNESKKLKRGTPVFTFPVGKLNDLVNELYGIFSNKITFEGE